MQGAFAQKDEAAPKIELQTGKNPT